MGKRDAYVGIKIFRARAHVCAGVVALGERRAPGGDAGVAADADVVPPRVAGLGGLVVLVVAARLLVLQLVDLDVDHGRPPDAPLPPGAAVHRGGGACGGRGGGGGG